MNVLSVEPSLVYELAKAIQRNKVNRQKKAGRWAKSAGLTIESLKGTFSDGFDKD